MGTARWWAWARLGTGIGILGVLVWRLGAAPFMNGVQQTTVWSVVVALAITALTTVSCARRWGIISARAGAELPLGRAVGAYYRSQFLNATLPGGVLGDVHRAVQHGRDVGDLGTSAKAVAGERGAGQITQIAVSLALLAAIPSPFRGRAVVVAAVASAALGVVALGVATRPVAARSRLGRWLVPVAGLSVVAAAGHVAIFLVAARTAGVAVGADLLPVALVVVLASAIPLNVAGWGPREGVAAWAFAAIGLPASQGLTVSVVYGVMALVATLPGAALLMLGRRAPATAAAAPARVDAEPAAPVWQGAAGG